MNKYLRILYSQISSQLIYKFDTCVKLALKVMQILTTVFIWKAIYISNEYNYIGEYSYNNMIMYIILANVASVIFSFEPCFRLGTLIHSGKLTTLLLRPIHLLYESFARYMGSKILEVTVYLILAFFMINAQGADILYVFFALIFLLLAFLMFFMCVSVISTIGFWIIQMWPLRSILTAIYLLMGGLYFPLDLLPKPYYMVLSVTPFAIVGHVLTKVLTCQVENTFILYYCLITLIWLVFLYYIYNILLSKGLKKYEGMGN